jgi:hypothetical protein
VKARCKPGPKPDSLRAQLRELFAEWSERTFATYYTAFRQFSALQHLGVITEAERQQITLSCTRPSGSFNVCKFARIAEGMAAFAALDMTKLDQESAS